MSRPSTARPAVSNTSERDQHPHPVPSTSASTSLQHKPRPASAFPSHRGDLGRAHISKKSEEKGGPAHSEAAKLRGGEKGRSEKRALSASSPYRGGQSGSAGRASSRGGSGRKRGGGEHRSRARCQSALDHSAQAGEEERWKKEELRRKRTADSARRQRSVFHHAEGDVWPYLPLTPPKLIESANGVVRAAPDLHVSTLPVDPLWPAERGEGEEKGEEGEREEGAGPNNLRRSEKVVDRRKAAEERARKSKEKEEEKQKRRRREEEEEEEGEEGEEGGEEEIVVLPESNTADNSKSVSKKGEGQGTSESESGYPSGSESEGERHLKVEGKVQVEEDPHTYVSPRKDRVKQEERSPVRRREEGERKKPDSDKQHLSKPAPATGASLELLELEMAANEDGRYPHALLSSHTYKEMLDREREKVVQKYSARPSTASNTLPPPPSGSVTWRGPDTTRSGGTTPTPRPSHLSTITIDSSTPAEGHYLFPRSSIKHMTPAVRAFFQRSVNTMHTPGRSSYPYTLLTHSREGTPLGGRGGGGGGGGGGVESARVGSSKMWPEVEEGGGGIDMEVVGLEGNGGNSEEIEALRRKLHNMLVASGRMPRPPPPSAGGGSGGGGREGDRHVRHPHRGGGGGGEGGKRRHIRSSQFDKSTVSLRKLAKLAVPKKHEYELDELRSEKRMKSAEEKRMKKMPTGPPPPTAARPGLGAEHLVKHEVKMWYIANGYRY